MTDETTTKVLDILPTATGSPAMDRVDIAAAARLDLDTASRALWALHHAGRAQTDGYNWWRTDDKETTP